MKDESLLPSGAMAQQSVIGSMLIDERCIRPVLALLAADDFIDGTCKATFQAIRRLTLEGKPADPVTVLDAMSGGPNYTAWLRDVMDLTPTAANVELYAGIVKEQTTLYRLREQADKLSVCMGLEEAEQAVRKMSALLSATSRMPRMTGAELAQDFLERMGRKEKPEYLPWGIPAADRTVYAEMGDMVLLGGYPSSGKTLLSILMALSQARRYKVGYYTLETQPEKMADRMFAHLAGVELDKIKARNFGEGEWKRFAQAANDFVSLCPFDIIRAAGSSVDDIASDAVGRGYQIVYVDYLQLIEAPGIRSGDRYAAVTAVSRGLKLFAQRTGTAVVALAQLTRPEKSGKGGKPVPPSMQSFRESGQIEQDADAAFLLWPEDPDNNASNRVLKLGKNKEGKKFRVTLRFDGATQTMTEVADKPDKNKPDLSIAAQMSAAGRAIRRQNRAVGQMRFMELPEGSDEDNPFLKKEDLL